MLGLVPPHHGVLLGVVLWDGDVVVGRLFSLRHRLRRLLAVPHDVVEVGEVVVQVDPLEAVASVGPPSQFRALQVINTFIFNRSFPLSRVFLFVLVDSTLDTFSFAFASRS